MPFMLSKIGLSSKTGVIHALAPTEVEIIPSFEVYRKNSTQLLAPNETIYGTLNSFYDLEIRPMPGVNISNSTVTMASTAQQIAPSGQNWIARLQWVTENIQQAFINVFVEGVVIAENQYIYLTAYTQPSGNYADIVEGSSYDLNKQVIWTVGLSDPGRTLVNITTGIFDAITLVPRSSRSFSDNIAASIPINSGQLPYGEWVLRTTYEYTLAPNEVFETYFSIPLPVATPFSSSLTLYPTEIFVDGGLTAVIYSDHVHTLTRLWLDINGSEHDLSLAQGTRTIIINANSYNLSAGTYNIQVHAQFSDTTPDISVSNTVMLTVNSIPVQTLLDNAYLNPSDNTAWQTIIDDPNSTDRQKLIASEIADLNDQIIAGDFGSLTAVVTQDRGLYVQEVSGSTNPMTFVEWRQQQLNFENAQELQDAKDFVTNAPTSSIAALLSVLDNTQIPHESLQDVFRDIDQIFIRDSYEHGVPESLILSDYRAYQAWILTAPMLIPFQDFVKL